MSVPVKVFTSINSGTRIEDYTHLHSRGANSFFQNPDSDSASDGNVSDADTSAMNNTDVLPSYFESNAIHVPRAAKKDNDSDEDDDDDDNDHQKFHYCNQMSSLSSDQESQVLDILQMDFSVVLYGPGSKKIILEQLQQHLNHYYIFIIQGYLSELTARNILGEFKDTFGTATMDIDSICEAIYNCDFNRILLVIHSLDRLIVNIPKFKDILIRMATLPNLQILATMDHINSQSLFPQNDLINMDLHWIHVPTFIPYFIERGCSVHGTARRFKHTTASAINNISHVYESLNSNAQRVFCLIIDYYLEKEKERRAEKEARKIKAAEKRKVAEREKRRSKRKKKDELENGEDQNEAHEDEHANNFTTNFVDPTLEETGPSGDFPLEPVFLPFRTLQKMCREAYLAHSMASLKTLLVEFEDHDILKMATSSDGSSGVRLKISLEVAQAFVDRITEQ